MLVKFLRVAGCVCVTESVSQATAVAESNKAHTQVLYIRFVDKILHTNISCSASEKY